jgi:hypothetical protein
MRLIISLRTAVRAWPCWTRDRAWGSPSLWTNESGSSMRCCLSNATVWRECALAILPVIPSVRRLSLSGLLGRCPRANRVRARVVRQKFSRTITCCQHKALIPSSRVRLSTFAVRGKRAHSRGGQMSCHAVAALWHKNLTHDATTIGASWHFEHYVNMQ